MSPKCFHSCIMSKKKVGDPSVGLLKLADGSLTVSCLTMLEVFTEKLSSVFINNKPDNPAPHQTWQGRFSHVPLFFSDVMKRLPEADVHSGLSPDGVHTLRLQSCSSLAMPLYITFKQSLSDGVLLGAWKTSAIVPVFRKMFLL